MILQRVKPFVRRFRCLKCLVMQLTCVPRLRAVLLNSMEFLKYAEAPNNVAQAVIEARGK
ncbi:elongation factor G [Salmonella bongori]|nr:elongation factor G [Salmonella bongori]